MKNQIFIDWEKVNSLLPVVVQDVSTKEVLMLAYMDKEAYELSLDSGYAHYFSRTKNRIWKKGEQSGHVQLIKAVFLDCDNDTLLLQVEQEGVACHTGRASCFFQRVDTNEILGEANESKKYDVLDRLYHIIQERKSADTSSSYVASLLKKGQNSYLKKVVEESGEFCFAVKDNDKKEIVYEGADLLFHMMVALGDKNIHPEQLLNELSRRFGMSGIEEKNSRKDEK